ncbi:MAG TPA: hypothetical protein VGA99_13805, partial [bacterium]
EPSLILESIERVGYYAWGDQHILAIFIVGNPPTLHIGDTRTGKSEMITENIGRSLHKDPYESAFSFVHKVSDSEWWIKRIDISSREITPLIQTLTGSEDYAWSPDSSLFMAQGSTLHRCNPKSDSQWLVIANFADAGIKQITRIAVTPNGKRLAFVSVE